MHKWKYVVLLIVGHISLINLILSNLKTDRNGHDELIEILSSPETSPEKKIR